MEPRSATSTRYLRLASLSDEEKDAFRNKYDVIFFDKDGTLQELSTAPIPGVDEAVATLAAHGKQMYMVTDNCLRSRESLANNMKAAFPQFTKENILTVNTFLIVHLKEIGFDKKIYVIGEEHGLVEELKEAGFNVVYDNEIKRLEIQDVYKTQLEEGVGAVVVSVDLNFSYLKIFKAVNYLRDPSVLFFATQNYPLAVTNPLVPAAGTLAASIEKVIGRSPVSCSKSSPVSVSSIKSLGHDLNRCLFVGDGLDNDIVVGNMCGMDTLLVLGGFHNLDDVETAIRKGETLKVPKYYASSVVELAELFRPQRIA